jgi:hypothetical protein
MSIDLIIRQKLVDKILQAQATQEELEKELKKEQKKELEKQAKVENVVLFILHTFGSEFGKHVVMQFKCDALRKKVGDNFELSSWALLALKEGEFNKVSDAIKARLSGFAGTSVPALTQKYFFWTFHHPWALQQLRAAPDVTKQVVGFKPTELMQAQQTHEEECDRKLVQSLDKREEVWGPADSLKVETHLLRPVAVKREADSKERNAKDAKETNVPLIQVVRLWIKSNTQALVRETVSSNFPLVGLVNLPEFDIASMPPLAFRASQHKKGVAFDVLAQSGRPIPIPAADSKAIAALPSAVALNSRVTALAPVLEVNSISFSAFRDLFVLDQIAKNLGVDPFCNGEQFTEAFFKQMFALVSQSYLARQDAAFFSGRSGSIPDDSPVKGFLDACQDFVVFRKKINTKVNVSFLLEWFYDASKEDRRLALGEFKNFSENVELLRNAIEDWEIPSKERCFVFFSLLQLPLLSQMLSFLNKLNAADCNVNAVFIVAFMRKGLVLQDIALMASICKIVSDFLLVHKASFRYKPNFWVHICQFNEAKSLVEILEEFKLIILNEKEKAAVVTASAAAAGKQNDAAWNGDLLDIFEKFLTDARYRVHVRDLNSYLQSKQIAFAPGVMHKLLIGVGSIRVPKQPANAAKVHNAHADAGAKKGSEYEEIVKTICEMPAKQILQRTFLQPFKFTCEAQELADGGLQITFSKDPNKGYPIQYPPEVRKDARFSKILSWQLRFFWGQNSN